MLRSESDPLSLQKLLSNKDVRKDTQHLFSYVRGREGAGRGGSRSKQETRVSCSVVV